MQELKTYSVSVGIPAFLDSVENPTGRNALHEDIEIKCFYEGTATLLVDSQTIDVKAGDVVVINSYAFHKTVNIGEGKGKYHLFMLPLDYFAGVPELDLHKLYYLDGKRFRTLFQQDTQLHGILMKVAEEYRSKQTGWELMIRSLLMEFFTLLLRKGITEAEYPTHGKSTKRLFSVIEPALQCIKNDYATDVTIEHLAELCNVSKHYFCRTFKAITQKSPMEYLREFRLRIANALLLNTSKSISEIASGCGFETPNYFSRCYRNQYGYSPRQSRQPRQEKSETPEREEPKHELDS